MRDDGAGPRSTRRTWLKGAAAASLLGACDPPSPGIPIDPRLFPPDGGPPGADPPRPRTFDTFEHGVASGDPLADGVILWTRVTTGGPGHEPPERVTVRWEIAEDVAFDEVLASGEVTTDAVRDWTVKVDVRGLEAAHTYFYRFEALERGSPIGRTRTAPAGPVDRLRFAVTSCASLGHGYFHTYAAIAQRADLDAVLHLGDYIYEYPSLVYGTRRELVPYHELLGVEHYRARYAQYRREPPLAEAHRQHPWIVTWDDHESANDAWRGGAENHDAVNEGPWENRLAASTRAFREWMPIRDDVDPRKIWRALPYGDLCEIVVLDTRTWGRDEQVWTPGDPRLFDEGRELLGEDQEAWVIDRLASSTARWKLVAQQVMLSPLEGIPNPDQWNGYPAARERLLRGIEATGVRDVVVLTGDIHSSWAMDLAPNPFDALAYDPRTGAGAVGVEIVTPAVSSPGLSSDFPVEAFKINNPHLRWADLASRGYVIVDLAASRAQADWFFVGDVEDELDDADGPAASFVTSSGVSRLSPAFSPAPPRPDAPPLA
ncbi:MAG: alkaline phosphatase D family protein [Sandaracinaceae bacterium]|nr:alkaline phosphatase D family protein [Sandaracinaceae bacterium]